VQRSPHLQPASGYIIIPQAIRVSIAPTVGFLVQLVKKYVADITDRLRGAHPRQPDHHLRHLRAVAGLLTAAAIYFVICFSLSQLSQMLERRIHVSR